MEGGLAYTEFSTDLRHSDSRGQLRFRLAQLAHDLFWGMSFAHKEPSSYLVEAVRLS